MGSPAELEVHAYFHNYHSKLKFIGSQVLRSRPDLPFCSQVAPSSSLHPEGSEGSICQWENCDVGASSKAKIMICVALLYRLISILSDITQPKLLPPGNRK